MSDDTRSAYGGDAVKAAIIASALPCMKFGDVLWATCFTVGCAGAASSFGATVFQSCMIGLITGSNYVFGFMDARRHVLDAAVRAAKGTSK